MLCVELNVLGVLLSIYYGFTKISMHTLCH